MNSAIKSLLQKQVIQICEPCKGDFYSTVFLTPKKDGISYRLIINLKQIKEFMVYQKFKMTTVLTCINLMTPGCYQAAVDLSDAYFSVKVHPKYRKYLRFIWQGTHYEFVDRLERAWLRAARLACRQPTNRAQRRPAEAKHVRHGDAVA